MRYTKFYRFWILTKFKKIQFITVKKSKIFCLYRVICGNFTHRRLLQNRLVVSFEVSVNLPVTAAPNTGSGSPSEGCEGTLCHALRSTGTNHSTIVGHILNDSVILLNMAAYDVLMRSNFMLTIVVEEKTTFLRF